LPVSGYTKVDPKPAMTVKMWRKTRNRYRLSAWVRAARIMDGSF
jgi:hypothetical protein